MQQVPDAPRGPDPSEVVAQLLVVSRALVGVAARSLADAGDVTLPQFRALVVLSARPGTPVSDLAAALDVHPTTATRLTDRLVAKGFVRRVKAAGDRRVTELHLSASGRRLVERVTRKRIRDLTEIVTRMPPDTWPAAIEALAEFSSAAGEPALVDLFAWETSVE